MKTVYQFNQEGYFIRSFKDAKEASKALGVESGDIYQIIRRKSCVGGSFYLSLDPIFTFPLKKSIFNPLFSKCGHSANGIMAEDLRELDRDIRTHSFNFKTLCYIGYEN